jgi:hypothetical protein
MLDSYFSKVIVTLIGAGCGVVGVAGGYYATFLLVTLLGN